MNSQRSDLLSDEVADSDGIDPEIVLGQILADPELVQHVLRTRNQEIETVTGYFRCAFAPRQQRFVLHIPFSPAMASEPHVEALVSEPENVRIRVTERRKFGARLEIILPVPTEAAMSVLVEVLATSEI